MAQLDAAPELVAALLAAVGTGLERYVEEAELQAPPHHRLAFRELGLAIGLAGLSVLQSAPLASRLKSSSLTSLGEIARRAPLRSEIESSWLRPANRQTPTWMAHQDINDVMLATSLMPEGFLAIGVGTAGSPKRSGHDGSTSRPERPFAD